MAVENENYKLEILEYAVNQSIDRLLPKSYEDALSVILHKSNEVVWRVATDIYPKSGHQIDFSFIKDILNLRIEPLQNKVAEEERIKAKLEAQKQIIKAEEERIRKEKEAEEARIRTKLEAAKLARKSEEQKQLQQFKKANPDVDIDDYRGLEIITKLKKIIVEQLEVGEEEVKLDTLFELLIPESYGDWRNKIDRKNTWCSSSLAISNKDADSIELIMAVEEEFDIEIDDQELEYTNLSSWNIGQLVNLVLQKI